MGGPEGRTGLRAGGDADHAFGVGDGWDWFNVVDFHGVEEISRPFWYHVTLSRPAGSTGLLDHLLDQPASLAIAAADRTGFYLRHGVIAEMEQIDGTPDIDLYRVALVPHLARARLRRRCLCSTAHRAP